jgi:hypothetical protein
LKRVQAEALIDRPPGEVVSHLADSSNQAAILAEAFEVIRASGTGSGAELDVRWRRGKQMDAVLRMVRATSDEVVLRTQADSPSRLGMGYWVQGGEAGSYVKLVMEYPTGFLGRAKAGSPGKDAKAILAKLKSRLEESGEVEQGPSRPEVNG